MLNRRIFLVRVSALGVAPLIAKAQPVGRIHRIGLMLMTSRANPATARLLQPFLQGMRELGYVEGRNLHIEWREAEGRPERLSAFAAELVALKVDLIVAGGHEAAHAAKNVTDAIPIVFVESSDPVGQGLVKSFARPGGNVTGFTGERLGAKRLDLLREVAPRIRRVAVIYVPREAPNVAALREPSAALKLELLLHEVRTEADLEGAFREIEQERAEGLLALGGVIVYAHRERVARFAVAQRLPSVFLLAQHVEAGGLMSYALNLADNWRRTVSYVDRILKGAKPADLPVQMATQLELVVNLKTAKAIELTIPQAVLLRADRVIE